MYACRQEVRANAFSDGIGPAQNLRMNDTHLTRL